MESSLEYRDIKEKLSCPDDWDVRGIIEAVRKKTDDEARGVIDFLLERLEEIHFLAEWDV